MSLFARPRPEAVTGEMWHETLDALPMLDGLDGEEDARLRQIAGVLLAEKQWSAAGGLVLDDAMRVRVAAQAGLLVLNLGAEWYRGWVEIIVYPDEFVPRHEWTDEAGVVHVSPHPLAGEAWERGPLILSWADAGRAGPFEGANVVIHEFAHKLDMLDGRTDGLPPLHRDMRIADWAAAFQPAFDNFAKSVDAGKDTGLDPYAAENPAEFFAVVTEYFFEAPDVISEDFPAVYEQLKRFFRQDPLARFIQWEERNASP